jgi:hypothetical protein
MEKFVKANGIELAYQEFGNQPHPAILLLNTWRVSTQILLVTELS